MSRVDPVLRRVRGQLRGPAVRRTAASGAALGAVRPSRADAVRQGEPAGRWSRRRWASPWRRGRPRHRSCSCATKPAGPAVERVDGPRARRTSRWSGRPRGVRPGPTGWRRSTGTHRDPSAACSEISSKTMVGLGEPDRGHRRRRTATAGVGPGTAAVVGKVGQGVPGRPAPATGDGLGDGGLGGRQCRRGRASSGGGPTASLPRSRRPAGGPRRGAGTMIGAETNRGAARRGVPRGPALNRDPGPDPARVPPPSVGPGRGGLARWSPAPGTAVRERPFATGLAVRDGLGRWGRTVGAGWPLAWTRTVVAVEARLRSPGWTGLDRAGGRDGRSGVRDGMPMTPRRGAPTRSNCSTANRPSARSFARGTAPGGRRGRRAVGEGAPIVWAVGAVARPGGASTMTIGAVDPAG